MYLRLLDWLFVGSLFGWLGPMHVMCCCFVCSFDCSSLFGLFVWSIFGVFSSLVWVVRCLFVCVFARFVRAFAIVFVVLLVC